MSIEQQQQDILKLEERAEELQSQQKLGECLGVLEEVLNKKRELFGEGSENYSKTSEKLCEICNIIAMIFLNKDKNDSCYEFLKKAELLSQHSALFKAITYNNLAQYCKKTNKVKTGIQYLQKAQEIQLKQGNPVLLADTHLNLCALLSQQERHQEALEHILIAVVLLQDEYAAVLQKKIQGQKDPKDQPKNDDKNKNQGDSNSGESNKQESQKQQDEAEEKEANEDLFSKLAIAYHNMGVEFEFLKRFDESLQTYDRAVSFARVNLGPENPLTKQFESVAESASQTIQESRQKEAARRKQSNAKAPSASAIYNVGMENKKPTSSQSNSKNNGQHNINSQKGKRAPSKGHQDQEQLDRPY